MKKKKRSAITYTTRLTMIVSLCIVIFAALFFLFLIWFPVKVENPSNGINEKLIAMMTTEATTTTTEVTTTSFINTRQTTDRNRDTVTETITETIE